ncbi:hypothetical protein K3495_g1844 [Podosphaera aphanis]|nr:hypothetical protein K3495_g1844 [Podosphaera aphanis]
MSPTHHLLPLALRVARRREICRLRRTYTAPPPSSDGPKPLTLRSQLPPHVLPLASPTTTPHAHAARPPIQRSLRPYIYATISVLVGCFAGHCVNALVAPPAPPAPHSSRDQLVAADLAAQAAQLPCVRAFTADPCWITSTPSDDEPSGSLLTTALAGSRALGAYQKRFTHSTTGEVVLIVWLGPSLAGWPGVTHGGALATLLDESLRHCVQASISTSTSQSLSLSRTRTLQLQVTYLKPVLTNCFYVLRATPLLSAESTSEAAASATLATVSGAVCVDAKAMISIADAEAV